MLPSLTLRALFARHPLGRRALALARVVPLLLPSACAPLTPARATAVALRGVCGPPGAGADSSCTVRSTERVRGGYRVTVDRRPPAGQDRVAVHVRRGGSLEVTPVATTGPTPRR